MSLTVVSSPLFAGHVTPPGHPESPERAEVLDGVAERARLRGVAVLEPRAASSGELERVHTREHVQAIAALRGRAVKIDEDTFTSPASVDLAMLAAGAGIVAVDAVLDRHATSALALVRPPGHHAESDRAMGFCFFNNIAVAAAHARSRGLGRVAVVDIDVHHGNGTQEMFYADPGVLFVSTHQYPLYPGTGAASETGTGHGRGFTVNLPVEAGGVDGDYEQIVEAAVAPAVQRYRPELLLVSAGFDAHEADPLAQMRLTTAGFGWLTASLAQMARDAGCGLVLMTEGGYALDALASSLDAVCGVLEGGTAITPADGWRTRTGRGDRTLASWRAAGSPGIAGL